MKKYVLYGLRFVNLMNTLPEVLDLTHWERKQPENMWNMVYYTCPAKQPIFVTCNYRQDIGTIFFPLKKVVGNRYDDMKGNEFRCYLGEKVRVIDSWMRSGKLNVVMGTKNNTRSFIFENALTNAPTNVLVNAPTNVLVNAPTNNFLTDELYFFNDALFSISSGTIMTTTSVVLSRLSERLEQHIDEKTELKCEFNVLQKAHNDLKDEHEHAKGYLEMLGSMPEKLELKRQLNELQKAYDELKDEYEHAKGYFELAPSFDNSKPLNVLCSKLGPGSSFEDSKHLESL